MRLNELRDNPGAYTQKVRVGRGIGSGKGKTAGRGVKGQKSRTGVALSGFEGGQMPLNRRMPKRGFNKPFRKKFNAVTLARLQQAVDAGRLDMAKVVDAAALIEAGVIRRGLDGVRVLATGELKAALKLHINHATAAATKAIETAGGSIDLILPVVHEADEIKRKKTAAKKAAKAEAK